MKVTTPTSAHISPIEDSRRWEHVPLRPDDIIISTPPKCGTTWTQRMVMSLLWPADDAPGSRGELSPWVDMRLWPIDEVSANLAAQTHRRFIKTHSPVNAIPFSPDVRYLVVYRDPPDALVSWGNHRRAMRPELVEFFNEQADLDGLDSIPITFDDDYDELLVEWADYWSPGVHLAPWWPLRHEPNVMFLYYGDMYADMSGWMRRIADFLELDIPDELWKATVDRCAIGAMREESRQREQMEVGFIGGADAFFHKGGDGRGRTSLSDDQLEQIRTHHEHLLPPEAVRWLETGGPLP